MFIIKDNIKIITFKISNELIVQDGIYDDEDIENGISRCDRVIVLHSIKSRHIRDFINAFYESNNDEEIISVYRYKKRGNSLIGIKRKCLSYFT